VRRLFGGGRSCARLAERKGDLRCFPSMSSSVCFIHDVACVHVIMAMDASRFQCVPCHGCHAPQAASNELQAASHMFQDIANMQATHLQYILGHYLHTQHAASDAFQGTLYVL